MLRYFSIFLCAVICCCVVLPRAEAAPSFKIVVNIPSRILQLYDGNQIKKEYSVGIGTRGNRTPIGNFQIVAKEKNPVWIKPVGENETPVVIQSGPDNPLGYRWMEFSELYGIHGTNDPASIGGYVSNGCIRMREHDVEELYELVPLHTPVEIVYNRVFVKKDAGGGIELHIYPDEYGIKKVTAKEVHQRLEPFGIQDFVSSSQLADALHKRGESVFSLGKAFSVMVFGKALPVKAVKQGESVYFPVFPLSAEAMVDVQWDGERKLLKSLYGSVSGYNKNNVLYVKEEDLYQLLHLYSGVLPDAQTLYLDYHQY